MKKNIIFSYFRNISNLSAPAKASFWFLIYSFMSQGVSIIATPIFTRIMPETAYGMVSVYNTWSGLLSIFLTLSIAANALMNGLIKFDDDQSGFISSMVALTFTLVGSGYLIVCALSKNIISATGLDMRLLTIMFLNLFLNASFGFWAVYERFRYKYKLLVSLNTFSLVLSQFVSYYFVSKAKSDIVFVKILSSSVITIIIQIIIVAYLIIDGKKLFNKKYWKYALKFCIPLLPFYLSNQILAQSDRIMISSMIGQAEAGVYSVAYTVGQGVNVLWIAIYATLVPWTYKVLKNQEDKSLAGVTTAVMFILAYICSIIAMFAPEIMFILAPAVYASGVYAIPPIIAGTFITFVYSMYSKILMYYEKNLYIAGISIVGAITNVLLNFIAIRKYGYIAAGYTTMISYALMLVLNYIGIRLIGKFHLYENTKLFLITFLLCLICIGITFTFSISWLRYLLIFVSCVIVFAFRKQVIDIISKLKEYKE